MQEKRSRFQEILTANMEGVKITTALQTFDEQYFEGVPESAWTFYIGGYQPAQKWLKDRKGMTLSFEDVMHYQRIIYVLQQTEQIMQEIDKINN